MKKNYFNILVPILCLTAILCGCTDEEIINAQQGQSTLELNRSCRIYTCPVNTDQIKRIEIDGEWMVTCNEEERNTPLQIYVEENSEQETRNGTIRILTQDGKWQETRIVQQGRAISEGTPDSYERVMGVGWGYDCNSYYGDPRGVKDQIFNPIKIKRLSKKHPGEALIEDEIYSTTSSFVCTGSSSTEFAKNLAIEADVHVGIPYAFSLDVQAKFSSSDLSSTNNYFTTKRYKSIIKQRSLDIGNLMTYVEQGEDIYTYGFKRYLQRIKDSGGDISVIREFVKVFGNSTVSTGEIGGKVDYNMTVQKSRTITTKDVEVGVTVGLLSMFSLSVSVDQQDTYDRIKENSKFNLSVKGGDVTILGKAVLDNEQCSSTSLQQWAESINDENAELIDCQLIPIWDLIDNKNIRNQIKSYITGDRIKEEGLAFPTPTSLSVKIPVPSFNKNGTQIKVGWAAGSPVVEFCNELIPAIDPKERVTVAYPIKDNKPDYQQGIFIGNGGRFAPGIIEWTGDLCSYKTLSEFEVADVLSYIYMENFSLNATATNENSYIDGTNKDVYIKCHNIDYPIVKVDTIVWFRKDLQCTELINGSDSLTTASNTADRMIIKKDSYYYPANSIFINNLAPVNWEIPNANHIKSIKSFMPTANSFLTDGASGLDINESGGYNANEKFQSGAFIITKNSCMEFTFLEAIKENKAIVKAPVRPVRSNTFRYK